MERYCRHIVYHRWTPEDTYRPLMSFDTLKEAVDYYDELIDQVPNKDMKVIDLEHIDLGNMLKAEDCAELIAGFRAMR